MMYLDSDKGRGEAMNSQKMMTVLIIFFLIINIGLFQYGVYQDKIKYTLSQERTNQVRIILEKNNILIYDHLPDFYPKQPLIVAKPDNLELELVDLFFGNSDRRIEYLETSRRYTDGYDQEKETKHLTFVQGAEKGRIYYGSAQPIYQQKTYGDRTSMLIIAEQFLEDFTLNLGEYQLTDERNGEKKSFYLYFFNEIFRDTLLFCNEVIVKVEPSGVTEARGIRYVPLDFEGEAKRIYPIDEVLYKFMLFVKKEELGDVRITDIDIGYDLGQDIESQETYMVIEPYYRIKVGSGETYYINAYTNIMIGH